MVFVILALCLVTLFPLCLIFGSVDIPLRDIWASLWGGEVSRQVWRVIVIDNRLPMAVTACLAGAALSVAGLLLQTTFSNPLAGPSILGISTGASLGVAVVMLAVGAAAVEGLAQTTLILLAAIAGAAAVLSVLLVFGAWVKSAIMLLIIGILVNYLTSSAIALLNFFATDQGVHSYVIWGLGNFNGVTPEMLPTFTIVILAAAAAAILLIKPLDALLLGERYAASMGVNVGQVRSAMLVVSGILTAVVTAFCGPIGFIGLVVPHIARLLLRSSSHRQLLPATILCGGVVGLLCTLLSVLPASAGVIPINAITPIIGVPVIIYIILCRRKVLYFN